MKGPEKLEKIFVEFEVVNASLFSVPVLAHWHEYFLDYKNFPSFKRDAAEDVLNVESTRAGLLRCSAHDVNVHLEPPEHFLLAARTKGHTKKVVRRTKSPRTH